MSDNSAPGPDAQTNHSLSLWREGTAKGILSHDTRLRPDLSFRVDKAAWLKGRYKSPLGRLLELDVTLKGPPGWVALHLGLPGGDWSGFGMIGLACLTAAPENMIVRPCVRSGTDDGFVDCFFDKHILSHPEASNHLDAIMIHRRTNLPVDAPWRELVLFLPTDSFRWSLQDLRLFIL